MIRESLLRLLPDDRWPETETVGGWWNRRNNPEIDLIGADREPVAKAIHFVGSIKWLEDRPFDRHDYDTLARSLPAVSRTICRWLGSGVRKTWFGRGRVDPGLGQLPKRASTELASWEAVPSSAR
ncbi:hypothetical protein [Nocardia abscessus]|uniref:hypothetical protein n=1 Tax=Nocardia abscessus TaxID=120957 RepID=UPI002458A321|nr:hypothetical protein [Nocardia abscessus]